MKKRLCWLLSLLICLLPPFMAHADTGDVMTSDPSLTQPDDSQSSGASAQQSGAAQNANSKPKYFEPTYVNMLKTMVHFRALDVTDNDVIDSYAQMEGCDLFNQFYKDDFQWNRIRGVYRQSFIINHAILPRAFIFMTRFQLDRYDFQQQTFRLTDATALRNVHRLTLAMRYNPNCKSGKGDLKNLPETIGVIVPPVTVEGIKASPDMAENLIAYMNSHDNTNRVIYGVFRVIIDYGAPWASNPDSPHHTSSYDFKGTLESIDFFSDHELKRPIWTFVRDYTADEEKERAVDELLGLKQQQGGDAAPAPVGSAAPAPLSTAQPNPQPTGASTPPSGTQQQEPHP